MIYITGCPKCHETISFLNGEDTKICKNCNEVVYHINNKPKEIEYDDTYEESDEK